MGADLALFPEMWSVGYRMPDPASAGEVERWSEQALAPTHPFLSRFRDLAHDLNMAIVVTYLEMHRGSPRNSLSVFDRYGSEVLTYSKVHTCDFDREALLDRGRDFNVVRLDTANGEVLVGAMICYDREFPESARLLMLKGAEVVVTPNACELEVNRLSQFRSRAFENMMAMVMTNYPRPRCNGRSVAFDGMAFNSDESSRDMLVVEADGTEGVWLAPIDMDALRDYRRRETWGNAFRRPELYSALTDEDVRDPFRRDSARRG
jgi:predicted amidohydrolase